MHYNDNIYIFIFIRSTTHKIIKDVKEQMQDDKVDIKYRHHKNYLQVSRTSIRISINGQLV